MLYQTLRTLDHHLGYPLVMFRQLVKCRVDYFHIWSRDCFPDIGYLLRTLIDQKNQKMHVRLSFLNRECHFFEKGCLTGFRR